MASYQAMFASAILPVFWLLCSLSTLSFIPCARSKIKELWSFVTFLVFAGLSLSSARTAFWFWPNLTSLWGESLLVCVVHVTSVLCWYKPSTNTRKLGCDGSSLWQAHAARLRAAYTLFWNPRNIPRQGPRREESGDYHHSLRRYLVFYGLSTVRLLIYYFAHFRLVPAVFDETLVQVEPWDVSPAQERAIPPILGAITAREAVVRAYFAIYWIWESYIHLDGAHTILACFFVSIGVDTPEEWPELYGKASSALGMRRFWARFWHDIVTRPYKRFGIMVARQLCSLEPGSTAFDTVVAFVVFLLSGISHAINGWYIGSVAWERNIWWFLLNFAACAAETAVLHGLRGVATRSAWLNSVLRDLEKSWLGDYVGYAWVFTFMFWSVPLWRYPQEYKQALAIERLNRVLSGMRIVSKTE